MLLYNSSLFGVSLHAESFCSLVVNVQSPTRKIIETRVEVSEHDGRLTQAITRNGIVRVCGLGILPVTVVVGDAGCNQVVVRNVPMDWNETRNLLVAYDIAPCQSDTPPVAACSFLLRFADPNGTPVGEVNFDERQPYASVQRSDEYGRMFIRIAASQTLSGIAKAAGFRPSNVSITCSSKTIVFEKRVTLEKAER